MLALTHCTLIDGSGGPPIPDTDVLLDGDAILRVGHGLPLPPGAQALDLTGKFLLPGFIDAHTHLGSSADLKRPPVAGRFVTYDYAQHREQALEWGVTTVRSAGDYMPDVLEVRDLAEQGALRSPRILAAGKVFQADGGHPGFSVYFGDPDILEHVCILVREDTDLEGEVAALARAGADWVKIFLSDDNKMKYPCTVPKLTIPQVERIVRAAHANGLPVMCHVDDATDLEQALTAGVDTIEHVINVATQDHTFAPALLERLADSDTWVAPTMVATKLHDGSIPGAPPVWPALHKAVGQMIQAGVKLGVGCDSGIPFVPYGECVHMEMELLRDAGMSELQAIAAATGGNASMLKRAEQFGTVRPGLAADLVVLGSDPLQDIRNTRDIRLVLRAGQIVFDRLI